MRSPRRRTASTASTASAKPPQAPGSSSLPPPKGSCPALSPPCPLTALPSHRPALSPPRSAGVGRERLWARAGPCRTCSGTAAIAWRQRPCSSPCSSPARANGTTQSPTGWKGEAPRCAACPAAASVHRLRAPPPRGAAQRARGTGAGTAPSAASITFRRQCARAKRPRQKKPPPAVLGPARSPPAARPQCSATPASQLQRGRPDAPARGPSPPAAYKERKTSCSLRRRVCSGLSRQPALGKCSRLGAGPRAPA